MFIGIFPAKKKIIELLASGKFKEEKMEQHNHSHARHNHAHSHGNSQPQTVHIDGEQNAVFPFLEEKNFIQRYWGSFFFLLFAVLHAVINLSQYFELSQKEVEEGGVEVGFFTRYVILFNILGLIYDNLIIGVGHFIKNEKILSKLSLLRFVLHGLLLPPLFPIVTSRMFENVPLLSPFIYLITILLVINGTVDALMVPTKLIRDNQLGFSRYTLSIFTFSFMFPAIIVILVSIIYSILYSTYYLLFTSLTTFILNSVHSRYFSITSNFAEIIFINGILHAFL